MALVLADRVRDTTTTTGTGTVTLSGTAPTGYQNFSVIGNANTTYYTINSDTQWEVGIGTYTSSGTTLSRNTVLASSNGGALVDFAIGIKDVFVTYPAEKAVTDVYGTALAATTAANIGGGAAGSIPYQTAANTTSLLAAGTGVLIGGATPSYTMSPSLTQVTVAGDPSTALQVATKQYVDTQTSAGIHFHEPVRVESPTNLNATYNNGTAGVGATLTNAGTQAALVIDGVTVIVADRVLIYQQTNPVQNGIYVVTNVGSGSTNWVLTRSSDADTYVNASPDGLSEGSTVFVQQGTTGAGTTYTCNTTGTITFGTTAITFVEISSAQIYSAGTGLTLTGTTFSLTAPVATSLGGTGLTTFTSGGAVYATSASVLTTGTLPATAGGTGQSSYTAGDLVYATSATTLGVIADVATGNALISGGAGADPSYGKIGLTTHISGTLAVGNGGTGATTLTGYLVGNGTSAFTATATIPTSALSGTISLTTQVSGTLGAGNGGTGLSSYTVGDILYASGTTTLASLADVATGNALISGGVSNAPLWGKIGLTTHVSGTLPVANGGSGATTLTGYLKGNGTSAFTASATIPAGDITGAALTKADDTNVTLTLGGSPSTALLAATSITAGWSGQLAVSRGGTGNSTLTSGYLLKGNGVSPTSASVVYDDGTNVGIGTASPASKLDVVTGVVGQILTLRGAGTAFGFASGVLAGANALELTTAGASGVQATRMLFRGGIDAADIEFYRGARGSETLSMFIEGDNGNLGLNTTTPAGKLSVVSGSSTGAATSAWSGNYSVFGPNAGGATGAAIALGYNTSADAAEILALAPAVAWKPLNLYSAGLNLYASSGAIGASLNGSGTFSAVTDIRAPIFYDSANTAYYVDPVSGSVLNRLVSITGAGNTNGGNLQLGDRDVNTAKWSVMTGGHYGGTSEPKGVMLIGSYSSSGANQVSIGGNVYEANPATQIVFFTATTTTHPTGGTSRLSIDGNGVVTASVDIRAPIFYDSANTAYYCNPNDVSSLYGVAVRGDVDATGIYNQLFLWDSGGTTTSAFGFKSGGVFASPTGAGDGYNTYLTMDTDGRGWVFRRGTGGNNFAAAFTSGWILNNGIWQAQASMRSPIFYDSDNTAYYMDPASTSVTYQVNVGFGINLSGSIALNASGATLANSTGARLGENYGPLWNLSDGATWHHQVINGSMLCGFLASGTNWGSGKVVANSDMRATLFYDYNDTAYYVDPASGTVLGGIVSILGGRNITLSSSGGNVQIKGDAGGWSNGLLFYGSANTFKGGFGALGSGDSLSYLWAGNDYNNSALYLYAANYAESPGSFRAPLFYDSNNTNYYVDAAGTSVLNSVAGYSLRNIEDVSIDTPYGIYFSSNLSTAYAIFREAGAWSHPYPDLRIAFHTGIKMGANSGYGGMKFYTDYDMVTQVMSINGTDGLGAANVFVNNALQVNGDIRTPIFYDVNDTAYYLNPNSTGTSLNVAGAIIAAGNVTAYSDIRIKANVETIPSALDKLGQIRGVTYTRTDLEDKEQRYAGVIAQEIEAVLPEAVRDLGDIKAVDYNATIALLIQAVKELTDKVKALEAKEQ